VSIRYAGIALVAAVGAVWSAPALGYTPAQNAAFAKKLALEIKPSFHSKAPGLVLGQVTCVLPQSGTVVKCKAHFSDKSANANIVYVINAKLTDSGTIKWTTGTHSCTDAKTGKTLSC
jgi:hypothetical protein